MEMEKYGEPMYLPKTHKAVVILEPPLNEDVSGSVEEDDAVWLNSEKGERFLFNVYDIVSFDPAFKLYEGNCNLVEEKDGQILIVKGVAYLLIRYSGKLAHQAELWVEKD